MKLADRIHEVLKDWPDGYVWVLFIYLAITLLLDALMGFRILVGWFEATP